MGKFRTCAINFKDKKEVYREGELVSGVMLLDVLEPVTVKAVRVFCYGQALTKWSKEFSRDWSTDLIGQETYFAWVVTVFGKKVNEEGPNRTLTVGKHRWNFAFRLPAERLPSSFEGEFGAIRWFLKVDVDKPFPSINNKWYRAFTVLSNLDMNEPVYQNPQSKSVTKTVSKALGLGNAGNIRLTAKTDRFGYSCGERIMLTVEAVNDSSKDMGKISATLVQRVVFTANDETKQTNLGINSLETEVALAKGTTVTLTDIQIPIPAVPPSTRKRTCHIISCTYNVKVTVHVPWGLNLDAVIPVAIGTIPRGKRAPPPRPPAGQARDPSTVIQYLRCQTGIVPCHKYYGTFPNFPFTPANAYNNNHTNVPTTTAPQAAAAAPSPAIPAAGIAMPGAIPLSKATEATVVPPAAAATRMSPSPSALGPMPAVPGAGLPPYSLPSAPHPEEMELPPSYEDVLKMDETRQKDASPNVAPSASSTSSTNTAAAAGAKAAPKGKTCAVMLVRFPDSQLGPFRDTIQREQNNLLDTEEAFLSALAPQPITGLERPNEEWPERSALAVLVFPNMDSGEEWLAGVGARGDTWYSACDALIMPASWHLATNSSECQRLIFTVATIKTREEATKERLTTFSKLVAAFTKIRQDLEGVRVATTKKFKMLHGSWLTSDQTAALTHWPKIDNYFTYRDTIKKTDYKQHMSEFHALFESQGVLLISEDVTSLSTQSTLDDVDDDSEGEDGREPGEGEGDAGETAENLMTDSNQLPSSS